jgi:hypothetical protein
MAQFLIWQPVHHVFLLASTWARMSIFTWIEKEGDFDSLIVMKNELQPETEVKLFASFICSRFMKQH